MNLFTLLDRKTRAVSRHVSHGARATVERVKYALQPGKPALSDHQLQAMRDLRTEGVHVTSLDQLFGHSPSADAYAQAAAFIRAPANQNDLSLWRQGISSRDVTASALLTHLPAVFMAGLDASLLSLVGSYLGKAPAYHGSVIRTSAVDGQSVGTRLWHQDAEDSNVFRMVVYLNDVEPGGGPFEYIPRSTGLSYRQLGSGPLTNERMQSVMPASAWRRVYGPAGTVVLCDTARVFHHESIQETRPRSVVMIGYSSRVPSNMELAMQHFPAEQVMPALMASLPADRLDHVVSWRRPAQVEREQQRRRAGARVATGLKTA